MTPRLAEALAASAAKVEAMLGALLPEHDGLDARLFAAMRYATLGGGKRLRPFLLLESARMFLVAEACALRAAAAVEMVHCYSLVHDDLPAMDDDDLRRGRPATLCSRPRSSCSPIRSPMATRRYASISCWRWPEPRGRRGWSAGR